MKTHLLALVTLTLSASALLAAPPSPTPEPNDQIPPNTRQQVQQHQQLVNPHPTTTVPHEGQVQNPPTKSTSDSHGTAPAN